MEEKVVILGSNWNKEDGAIKPLVNGYTITSSINPVLCNAYRTLSMLTDIKPILDEFNYGTVEMSTNITDDVTGISKDEMIETLLSLSDDEIDDLFEQPVMFRGFANCVFENKQELCERGEDGKNILKKFVHKVLSPECTATDRGNDYFSEIDRALSVLADDTTWEEPVFDKQLLEKFFSENDCNLDRGYGFSVDISKILIECRPKYDMRSMLVYIHRGYHKNGDIDLDYIINDIIENIDAYKKSLELSENVLRLSVFNTVSPETLIKLYEIVKMFDGKINLGVVGLEKSAIETDEKEAVVSIIKEIIKNTGELGALYYISIFSKQLLGHIEFDPLSIAKAVFSKPFDTDMLYAVLEDLVILEETRYFTLRSLLTSYKGEEERKNIIKIIKGLIDLNDPKLCLDIMLYFMHEFTLTDATAITLELLVGAGKETIKRSGAELIASLMAHPEVTSLKQTKDIYNVLIGLHR